jgi:hypothetical protein
LHPASKKRKPKNNADKFWRQKNDILSASQPSRFALIGWLQNKSRKILQWNRRIETHGKFPDNREISFCRDLACTMLYPIA